MNSNDLYIMKLSGEFVKDIYKVGMSKDVKRRVKSILSHIPFADVTLVHVAIGMGCYESLLHEELEPYRVGGEYFRPNSIIDSIIDGHVTVYQLVEHKRKIELAEGNIVIPTILPDTPSGRRAAKIKQYMEDQKITTVDLEKLSGVHRNTIGNALHAKGITVTSLEGIARGLGVSPTMFI